MASFCAVLFPTLDVLDEIWDLIESVSEGSPSYRRYLDDALKILYNPYFEGFL